MKPFWQADVSCFSWVDEPYFICGKATRTVGQSGSEVEMVIDDTEVMVTGDIDRPEEIKTGEHMDVDVDEQFMDGNDEMNVDSASEQ